MIPPPLRVIRVCELLSLIHISYKKERVLAGKPYFSVASGGGTGRTLHPDNMAAGPASYGMTCLLYTSTLQALVSAPVP